MHEILIIVFTTLLKACKISKQSAIINVWICSTLKYFSFPWKLISELFILNIYLYIYLKKTIQTHECLIFKSRWNTLYIFSVNIGKCDV